MNLVLHVVTGSADRRMAFLSPFLWVSVSCFRVGHAGAGSSCPMDMSVWGRAGIKSKYS